MEKNCKSAAQYFKELGSKFLLNLETSPQNAPIILIQKRLDSEFLFQEEDKAGVENELFNDNPEELQFIRMSSDLGKISYIIQMGYIYYYGLRGVKKDYEKAFEYFYKAAKLGDTGAKTTIGYMYLSGLGTEQVFITNNK